ncbi:DNA polymerase-1 [Paraoerskovia marina]|uniref:DNA-directed DNA polymerase n=1 Tax=Paraoerskovia marina TaxID=545619 RepID=A0A1H1S1L2_9CELL|nr:bifunctional 3'-5' exonuclease/DNA polymerase [Paraoerskovia marina]SDS41748.1 DNA polymerase-1 [Paraoerskovia marina]
MHLVCRPGTGRPDGPEVLAVPPGQDVAQPPETFTTAYERSSSTDRWVWADTAVTYRDLLRGGHRVERAHDLRLARRVLRSAAALEASTYATAPADPWDDPAPVASSFPARQAETLFDVAAPVAPDPVEELLAQQGAVDGSARPGALRLLLAAESSAALVAAEMHHAGLPWSARVHDELLRSELGPRPRDGERPARMHELVESVRAALDAPSLNPDSQPDLLRALRYAGVSVDSTRQWDLERVDHPVIGPLLEYKRLARLLTANGWAWIDAWVHDGRFRPDYVVSGAPSGRWATSGGGALQLPHAVRPAVVADPGWTLVVADAAQLEPRVLAGLARDERLATAGRGGDIYAGLVDQGVVDSREHAKVGMLGALYGGTSGDSGLVRPRLVRAFPAALGFVDAAAREGERGRRVSTLLGRTSPPPSGGWGEAQSGAFADSATADDESRARATGRAQGRFTRNFVVQGTAAEWASCWLASIRQRLAALPVATDACLAPAPFAEQAHLVYFLHDEVVVHAPAGQADDVAAILRESAAAAGRLLFGDLDLDFPVTVAVVESYARAK